MKLPDGLALQQQFLKAEPFPHIVLDNLWPAWMLWGIEAEFNRDIFTVTDHKHSNKLFLEDVNKFPARCGRLLQAGNSLLMLYFLRELTGIYELRADHEFLGGGMHKHENDGFLSIHRDFTHHLGNGMPRVLNMLLYVHKEWEAAWGGCLELWPEDFNPWQMKSIPPTRNRTVIFQTSERSWHGLPKRVSTPNGKTRNSLAWYYYAGRPQPEKAGDPETVWATLTGDSANADA